MVLATNRTLRGGLADVIEGASVTHCFCTNQRPKRTPHRLSTPLHLACSLANAPLVNHLLDKKGCRANVPDASGSFPVHLACSGPGFDNERTACVTALLFTGGVPISVKDGNKQTVLHCAARVGHVGLLTFLLDAWRKSGDEGREERRFYWWWCEGVHYRS